MPCIWLKHLATAFRAKGFLTNPTVNRFGIGQSGRFRSKRSEEHTSELQSQSNLVCRLLLEKTIDDLELQPQVGIEGPGAAFLDGLRPGCEQPLQGRGVSGDVLHRNGRVHVELDGYREFPPD